MNPHHLRIEATQLGKLEAATPIPNSLFRKCHFSVLEHGIQSNIHIEGTISSHKRVCHSRFDNFSVALSFQRRHPLQQPNPSPTLRDSWPTDLVDEQTGSGTGAWRGCGGGSE